jgi:hypothetical protein
LLSSESLPSVANRVIPFPLAAKWAGVDAGGRAKAHCPFGFEHDDGGREQAFRVYPDHGWCFAEQRFFTVTSLLAAVWEVSRDDAAAEALRRYGWKPASLAHLWEGVTREPEPDRGALRAALSTWCSSRCPDWAERQYDPAAAGRLGQCFGLLPLVTSEQDCEKWLAAAKKAMAPYLT